MHALFSNNNKFSEKSNYSSESTYGSYLCKFHSSFAYWVLWPSTAVPPVPCGPPLFVSQLQAALFLLQVSDEARPLCLRTEESSHERKIISEIWTREIELLLQLFIKAEYWTSLTGYQSTCNKFFGDITILHLAGVWLDTRTTCNREKLNPSCNL